MRLPKKIIAVSLLAGLLITIFMYSATYRSEYPLLTADEKTQLEPIYGKRTDVVYYAGPHIVTKEVVTDGLPLRSKFVDNEALTLDYGATGFVTPLIVILFYRSPSLYLNFIFWSALVFVLITLIKKKQHANHRH